MDLLWRQNRIINSEIGESSPDRSGFTNPKIAAEMTAFCKICPLNLLGVTIQYGSSFTVHHGADMVPLIFSNKRISPFAIH